MDRPEAHYYFRLSTLLLDGSTKVLRRLLLKYANGDLDHFLMVHQEDLKKLKLQKYQEDAIRSHQNKRANIEEMDITFLCTLLLHLCNLDEDEKSFIEELREQRNAVFAHAAKAALSKKEFMSQWGKTVDIVTDIAEKVEDQSLLSEMKSFFRRVKTGPLDPTSKDRLQEWQQRDSELENSLRALSKEVRSLKSDVETMKGTTVDVSNNIKKQSLMFLESTDLDDLFVTEQIREAERHLESQHCVTVIGRPGEGKTCSVLFLVKGLVEKGLASLERCVLLHSPSEWKYVDVETVDVIILDDSFGKHNLDSSRLSEWRPILEKLQGSVKRKQIFMILTSRKHIFNSVAVSVRQLVMFSRVIDLSTDRMQDGDKESLFRQVLSKHQRDISSLDVNRCIRSTASKIGFPYCVKQFASNDTLFERKESFFDNPCEYFMENLENMCKENKSQYLALLYIFYQQNNLDEDGLNVLRMSPSQADQLQRLAKLLGMTEGLEAITSVVADAVDSLLDVYVVLYNERYTFIHDTMYEMIAILHSKRYTDEVVTVCTTDYLCQCVTTEERTEGNILFVKRRFYRSLAQRMIKEVSYMNNSSRMAKHQSLKNSEFVKTLFKCLNDDIGIIPTFYMANVSFAITGIHGFVHHVLKNKECIKEFVEGVFPQLHCEIKRNAKHNSRACWKCKVKTEALMGACAGGQLKILKSLLDEGAEVRTICLFYALSNPNIEDGFVGEVIKTLIAKHKLSSQDYCISYAIGLAWQREDKRLFRLLLENGLRLSSKSLYYFVISGDVGSVKTAIDELKAKDLWVTDDFHLCRALTLSYTMTDKTMFELLLNEGMAITTSCLFWSVFDHNYDTVKAVVNELKLNGRWDPECDFAGIGYSRTRILPNKNIGICLKEVGMMSTVSDLWHVIESGQNATEVQNTLQKLKDEGRWNMDDHYFGLAIVRARSLPNEQIYDLLKNAGVTVSERSLYFAVREHGIDVLQDIVSDIKEEGTWDPGNWFVARAIVGTYAFQDESSRKVLVSEGAVVNSKCIYWAVKEHSCRVVSTILDSLSKLERQRDGVFTCNMARAYAEAIAICDPDKENLLLAHGAKLITACLYWAVVEQHQNVLIQLINDINYRQLQEEDEYCARALAHAFSIPDEEKLNILLDAGLKLTSCCLSWAVRDHDVEVVEGIIKELKNTGLWNPNHPAVASALTLASAQGKKATEALLISANTHTSS